MTADIAKLKEQLREPIKFTGTTSEDARNIYDDIRLRAANAIEALEKERDELRATIFGSSNYCPSLKNGNFIEMVKGTEAGRLGAITRAEAAEKRVAELELTFTDERGTVWSPPTAEAYQRVCVARNKWQSRADTLEAALRTIRDLPITNPDENQDAVNMHLIARKALGDQL